MPSLRIARQLGGLRLGCRGEGVYQRRFADPGLAYQQVHLAAQSLREFGDALAGLTAYLDAAEVQAPIFVELRLDCARSKVPLIYDDQGIEIFERGTRPVAVHQEPIRFRLRGCDDGKIVDIGRYRLGASARVDSLD